MPRNLAPVGDEFLETAGLVIEGSVDLPHSPEQVWKLLTSDDMGSWMGNFTQATWKSAPPQTTGAQRRVRLFRLITIDEEYYRWDAPRRATFRVTRISVPGFDGWAEDLRLERRDGGGTRLTLTMAIDNKLFRVVRIPKRLQPKVTAACEKAMAGITKILPPPEGC